MEVVLLIAAVLAVMILMYISHRRGYDAGYVEGYCDATEFEGKNAKVSL